MSVYGAVMTGAASGTKNMILNRGRLAERLAITDTIYGRKAGWARTALALLVAAIVVALGVLIGVLVIKTDTAAQTPIKAAEQNPTQDDIDRLCGLDDVVCLGEAYATPEQSEWIDLLERCESSGDPKAVNPKDLDGTPSYGSFQFKPGTFRMYKARYGTEGNMMDRTAQREIVVRMLGDKRVRWGTEFPDCVSKIGLPPL